MSDFAASLKEFLTGQVRLREADIEQDTALFSTGILDSFAMMQLVTFIEKTAGCKVKAREVTLENLDSPSKIVAFVEAKTTG